MKIAITTFLLFLSTYSFSQEKKTYNTNIKEAKVVNIKSGKITIGKIIINQAAKAKIILNRFTQEKDSTGLLKTIFYCENPESLPFYGVKLNLKFDKEVDDVQIGINGTATMMEWSLNSNKTEYNYKATQIISDILMIIITSKTPVVTTITGIDGKSF